jgi:hypothetical protein
MENPGLPINLKGGQAKMDGFRQVIGHRRITSRPGKDMA